MKRLFRGLISFVFCMALLAGVFSQTGYALTKEEAIERNKELQQQLIDINSKLADIRDDIEKAEEKLKTLNERIAVVEEQIELLQLIIDETEADLALKQAELDAKIQEFDENYQLYQDRILTMYMANDTSMLSVLLGATSFSEFLTTVEYMRIISEHDDALLDQLEEEQRVIEAAKSAIEEKLAELEVEKGDLDVKRNELALLRQEANATLSYAEAQEQLSVAEREKILAERDTVQRELDAMMGTGMIDYVGGYFAWPVPGYSWISSGFGWRTLYGVPNYHTGIDIAGGGIYGARVIASNSGRVVRVQYATTGYGYHVMIDHGDNNWTVYAHFSAIAVSNGDWVSQGQTVGYVGSTGNSTGPHLHFEIRINGVQIDPSTIVRYGI